MRVSAISILVRLPSLVMSEDRAPEVQLIDDLTGDELVQLAVDLGEVPYGALLGDAVGEIPILRALYGGARVVLGVSDQLFVRKLYACYSAAGGASTDKRREMLKRLDDPREARRAGELLLSRIQAAADSSRAEVIGKVFAHCARTERSWYDCERMIEMVVAAYAGDLRYFLERGALGMGETGDEVERLVSLGFYVRELAGFGDRVFPSRLPRLSLNYGAPILEACGTIGPRS